MSSSSASRIPATENVCDRCENRELCCVYNGESCLLIREHLEEIERV